MVRKENPSLLNKQLIKHNLLSVTETKYMNSLNIRSVLWIDEEFMPAKCRALH